jgi:hypothetical protein
MTVKRVQLASPFLIGEYMMMPVVTLILNSLYNLPVYSADNEDCLGLLQIRELPIIKDVPVYNPRTGATTMYDITKLKLNF